MRLGECICRFATACVARKVRVRRRKIDRLIGKISLGGRITSAMMVKGVRITNKDEVS